MREFPNWQKNRVVRPSKPRRRPSSHPPPSPRPQHPEVYLDKTHNWLLEGVPYVDRVKYAEAQPEKPKRGFGTSDYSKRDEFSMDFRTEQMREALKSEARHQAIASEKAKAAMEKELAASGGALRGTEANEESAEEGSRRRSRKPLLYDSVFDGEDAYPTAVRDSMIEGRDSKNPTQISWERDFGTMRTSAHSIGHGIDQAEHGKPQFARLPIVESTFYRPQGVPISQGKTVFNSRPQ